MSVTSNGNVSAISLPQTLPAEMPLVESALAWAIAGFPVLPCSPVSKRPLLPRESAPGASDGGLYLASRDPAQISTWWRKNPDALIGIRTGRPAGALVIDLDPTDAPVADMLAFVRNFCGHDFCCPIAVTQSGGNHLYFKMAEDDNIGNRVDLFRRHNGYDCPGKIDVRGNGGYVIAPPSIMDDDRRYTWSEETTRDLGPIPERLLDLILRRNEFDPSAADPNLPDFQTDGIPNFVPVNTCAYALAAVRAESVELANARPGSRGGTLNRAAFRLGQLIGAGTLTAQVVREFLIEASRANGLLETDGQPAVERTIERGLNAGLAHPRHISNVVDFAQRGRPSKVKDRHQRAGSKKVDGGPADDGVERVEKPISEDSVAIEFVQLNADKLKYCHSRGAWYIWNGAYWAVDRQHLAFSWCRKRARESAKTRDVRTKVVAGKAAFSSGVEKFAQRDKKFAVIAEFWDPNPFLLGTPGGTVDLRTGDLRPADPREGISRVTAVEPSDLLDCPLWLAFLDEATRGDAELIRFLQIWCGYNLTGSIKEQSLIFIYGDGGNGKGVFLNTVAKILKDYCVTASMDLVLAQRFSQHPTEFAGLAGARMVTAQETEKGRSFAESRIKTMTGGDKISARFMRQDFFEYMPQFKLTLVGNDQPALKNVDAALRRRFNIVPFVHKPTTVDYELEEKLCAEWPSILRWMIDGCLDWQANGLIRPACVLDATEEYFQEQDLLAQWLAEKCDCEVDNHYKFETTAALFISWSSYCSAAKEDPGTKKTLSATLQKRGFKSYRTASERGLLGIRLKPSPDRYNSDEY